MIKRIINRVKRIYYYSTPERFCKYLSMGGVQIGTGNHIDPKSFHIDLTRPSLITIGNNCYFNRNATILTHDWVTNVFLNSNRKFLNSSGRVTIGDNVSFGENVTILKGVTIGDNCFIGAGSIVSKDIPANSIAVGAPCKVIMTLEDYYQKRLVISEEEALDYARSIKERYHRKPLPTDFWEEFIWFVSGDEVDKYPEIPIHRQLGSSFEKYKSSHKAKYSSFEDFLKAAGI